MTSPISDKDMEDSNEETARIYNLDQKIFVGNLGYRIQRKELALFFSKFGSVCKTHIVMDHLKHHSRGIAFVYFKSKEDADRALQATDEELVLGGRLLRVHPAEESKRTTFKKYSSLPDFNKTAEHLVSEETEDTTDNSNKDTASARVSLTLNDLCYELLVEIFSYLPIKDKAKIERVCHRWRILALQTWATVKSLHFTNMFRHFNGLVDKTLNSILQRCGHSLKSLDLSASPHFLTDYAMDIIARYCPDLSKLDISGADATNKSLQSFSTKCTKLKWVRLQHCLHVSEKGLWWLLHNCQMLEYLDIMGSVSITGKCFHMLGPSLKTAVLSNCSNLSDTAIIKLGEKCPGLETLYIDNCHKVTDVAIRSMCQRLTNLEFLSVRGSFPLVTNKDSWVELQFLTKLTYLNVSNNQDISDDVLAAISNGCLLLKDLDISRCHRQITGAGFQALSHLEHLEVLNISYLYKVSDEDLYLLALNGRLQKLTARACSNITDSGVTSLVENCLQLSHLDLSGCMQVTNRALKAVISSFENQERDIEVILGGTSVVLTEVTVPPRIVICQQDLSVYHLYPNRELLLPEPNEDDGEENEYPKEAYLPAGMEETEDSWLEDETFTDYRDDYLLGDDPLAAEVWDLS